MGLERFTRSFQDKARHKKLIIIVCFGLVIALLVIGTRKSNKSNTNDIMKQQAVERTSQSIFNNQKYVASQAQNISIGDNTEQEQNVWIANGQKQLDEANQSLNKLSNQYNSTTQDMDVERQQVAQLDQKLDQLNQVITQQQQVIAAIKPGGHDNQQRKVDTVKPPKQIQEIDMSLDTGSAILKKNSGEKVVSTKDIKDSSQYIPSNTFVKGILISSLDADTGGNANSDPTPVLIRITNLANMPNFFKANVKNCMVGGSGYGDLSTERVKIRLTNLSCVLTNGHVIDIPVKGYIAGEDGKAGIRGIVVGHEGSILAKAALAGLLQGVGQTAENSEQTQMVSPIGTTSTISPNQAAGAAVGSGAANAFNNLSQYYVNMLTQIFPTIEVSSGRNITVIFTAGISLKEKLDSNLGDASLLPFNQLGV